MSLEQAKHFIERMKNDEAFRTKIMGVDDVTERLRLANADGYDCTQEEIKSASAELSDVEVDGVAGGTSCKGGWEGYLFI